LENHVKKIASAIAVSFVVGCAAPGAHIDNMVKRGDFVSAYKFAIVRGEKSDQKTEFLSSLKSHPSGFSSDKFYQSVSTDINGSYKSESNFIEFSRLIKLSYTDGLISEAQSKALIAELIYIIQNEGVANPGILKSQTLLAALPEISFPDAKKDAFNFKFKLLSGKQGVKLPELLPLIISAPTLNDADFTNRLNQFSYKIAKSDADYLATGAINAKISFLDFLPLVSFANLYGNADFSNQVKSLLSKVNFSKADLRSPEVLKLDAEFSNRELAGRIAKYKLAIEPDDGAFHEDISKLLSIKNEWIEFDDESKNILLIKRHRFLENLGTPSNGTEIVPDPNFATLLFIPKNASVLFDYVTTEYRIDYSIDVVLQPNGKKATIRGADTMRKTECRNIRFQNVFGGVGPLNFYPNDRVQNFCTSSNGASFDGLKNQVTEKISTEIYSFLLAK
jgi:hypothetical protein